MAMRQSRSARAVVAAYETGYYVTEDGEVVSPYNGRVLRLTACDGRPRFTACFGDWQYTILVSQLLAYQLWGRDALAEAIVVRHLDDDPTNNTPDNLALGTVLDNIMDMPPETRHLKARKGGLTQSPLAADDVWAIRELLAAGWPQGRIAEEYGIHISTVSSIHTGRRWAWL